MFLMRFAMRAPDATAAERAAQYGALLEMAAWADTRPCLALVLSQHHGVDDGYLPSPVPVAAAVAARTSSLSISVAALLLALYEPVKLAEDLAVVDLVSRGRVSYVVGIGYRDEEFHLFGVDRRRRAALVEQRIVELRALWRGETVEVDGRSARITPLPYTPGGPMLAYGGGSRAAAERAGRLGMLFLAETSDPVLANAYAAAATAAGVEAPGAILPDPDAPLTAFVSEDPDRAWAELGPHLLADARSYASWNAGRPATASVSFATTVDELRSEHGAYQVLTPAEAAAQLARGVPLSLQPLVGGLPPDQAWPYLEAAAAVNGGIGH
jgi:alkanesulfonate monooxygenase SsuD/methylene tetrahydromethanopterin reductase-like flavin-dependent oxidoreductase (luciferase family)